MASGSNISSGGSKIKGATSAKNRDRQTRDWLSSIKNEAPF